MKKKNLETSVVCCILCAGLWTASCNGNSNTNNSTDQKGENALKTVVDNNTGTASNSDDTEDNNNLTSPDLTFYDLQGPVKYMKNGEMIYQFNTKGELISVNGYNPFEGSCYDNAYYNSRISLTRNEDNYFVEESGWEWNTEYTWKDGRIVHESTQAEADIYEYDFKYNDKGELSVKEGYTCTCGDEDNRVRVYFSYSGYKRDSYGNWIERTERDGIEDISEQIKRTIVYYQSDTDEVVFNSEKQSYKFIGTIGGQKDASLEIGPDGGSYVLSGGRRGLKLGFFDPSDNTLCLFSYLKGSTLPIGVFSGKLVDGVYKGVFTNTSTYGKVDFKLTLE